MRNEDFIELMMILEQKKKDIRDSAKKNNSNTSDVEESIIKFVDTLIFDLLERQHESFKPVLNMPVYRDGELMASKRTPPSVTYIGDGK